MKLILILACLVLFMAYAQSESECKGRPDTPRCHGRSQSGNKENPRCGRNANDNMWYWDLDTKTCKKMKYKGCGGNFNRHCSLYDCTWRCYH